MAQTTLVVIVAVNYSKGYMLRSPKSSMTTLAGKTQVRYKNWRTDTILELLIQLFQETANTLLHFIYPFSDVRVALRRVGILVILHRGFSLRWSVKLLMQILSLRLSCCATILILCIARGCHWLILLRRKSRRRYSRMRRRRLGGGRKSGRVRVVGVLLNWHGGCSLHGGRWWGMAIVLAWWRRRWRWCKRRRTLWCTRH